MTQTPVLSPPSSQEPSVLDRPLVSFGREVCGELDAGLRREWLVTNGLGGYASGTLAGVNTRRYHGLLVAALSPPVERTVLVGGLVEQATYDGHRYPLSAHEYGDGTIDPHGERHLESFALEGMLPVWTFALADALLERRIWMARGANTTYVSYHLRRGTRPLHLNLTPLLTCRDFHSLGLPDGWRPDEDLRAGDQSIIVRLPLSGDRPPLRLLADGGSFHAGGDWYWNFRHREEAARGLDDRSNMYAPGAFSVTLTPGESVTLILTIEAEEPVTAERALAAARARQRELLQRAGAEQADRVMQQLTLAADQFLVERRPAGTTVIAGYHWFNDWGRDTMIALPGLTLATGRPDEAADLLRTFARYVADGLLPNNFPDSAGVIPGYNTADATLWYVLAIAAYREATGDEALVDELLSVIRDIVDRHLEGTRYGIGVDPEDGLLRAGEPGLQLTWMDAKVGDWVVTPRTGKPVEINALWYNVLRSLAAFLAARDDPSASAYDAHADRVLASFRSRFLPADGGSLADVVDGPDGDDRTLRPNQILAVSLPFPLLDGEAAASVVEAAGRALLTSYGLRSLAPDAPAYQGDYGGDVRRRDGAYHQGPVWPWLLGPYVEAYARVTGGRDGALALLRPIEHHLQDAGLGSVSEILEGDPPHRPRGCVAQAWSVAEILRVWRKWERST